jgi:hypothetical protein
VANYRLYQYTAIGRPLDPSWPSNRAVLILLPLAVLLGAGLGWAGGDNLVELLLRGLRLAVLMFLAWALARELDPDDHSAAFVALAIAVIVGVAIPDAGLLTAVATLGLVRCVNRSTGLPARKSDSAVLMLLAIAVIYLTGSPLFGAVAALAFVLDGSLRDPLRHQWLFALICLGAMVVYLVDYDVSPWAVAAPDTLFEWLSVLVLLMFALYLLLTKSVRARGDVGNHPLDLARVRGGMAVGLAAALQGLGQPGQVAVIVAALGGICIGMAIRKGFRAPVASES